MENKKQDDGKDQNQGVGVTETQTEFKIKLDVISDNIYGTRKETSKLYLILWERICNHGTILCWAENEEQAYEIYSFKSNKSVRHTIIEVNPESMPVTDGREAN